MSSNYPAGAEFSPFAPWNERESVLYEHDVVVSERFVRKVVLQTADNEPNFSELEDAYYDQHYSLQNLLCELERRLQEDIDKGELAPQARGRLKDMLSQTQSFKFEEFEIE